MGHGVIPARDEWIRLFARRFTTLMILVGLAILGLVAAGVLMSSHRATPAARADAQAQAEQQRAAIRAERAECEKIQQGGGDAQGKFPPGFDCAQINDSYVDPANYMPHEFDFREEAP